MLNRSKTYAPLCAALLGITLAGCGDNMATSEAPKGKMEGGAMEKDKMEGGAMDKGKMEGGAMDKGKMEGGAMDKDKMGTPPK